MRKKAHESHTLVEPQRAVRVYLDALLCEVDLITETEPEVRTKVVDDPALEKALQRATESTSLTDVVPEVVPEIAPQAAPEVTAAVGKAVTAENEAIDTSHTQGGRIRVPDWAQAPFQCLSFQVAGVTLAAPLEKLNGIVELREEITELPGYAPWVIGLLPNRGQNVQVVDVAQIIMPADSGALIQPAVDRMKFIILLGDSNFGLAVDSISQVLSLETDDVRWRGVQSKRPWLAGTVTEQMCALLEIGLLCEQLQAGLEGA